MNKIKLVGIFISIGKNVLDLNTIKGENPMLRATIKGLEIYGESFKGRYVVVIEDYNKLSPGFKHEEIINRFYEKVKNEAMPDIVIGNLLRKGYEEFRDYILYLSGKILHEESILGFEEYPFTTYNDPFAALDILITIRRELLKNNLDMEIGLSNEILKRYNGLPNYIVNNIIESLINTKKSIYEVMIKNYGIHPINLSNRNIDQIHNKLFRCQLCDNWHGYEDKDTISGYSNAICNSCIDSKY